MLKLIPTAASITTPFSAPSTAAMVDSLAATQAISYGRADYRPDIFMRAFIKLVRQLKIGALHVVLPNGKVEYVETLTGGPEGVIVIHSPRFARRFLVGGTLGFCESYLDGDWSSPNMMALFEVALQNEQTLRTLLKGKLWYRLVQGLLNFAKRNTKQGSKRNIAYHYDLGNDFYRHWLDRSMTYSSAIYATAQETLEQAQQNKYAALCAALRLQPGQHVLEVGCGWGGFAEYAAKNHGVRVTGITISQAQFDFATARMTTAGLNSQVQIKLCDYRDVTGSFDAVASIEMFEAVGEEYWPSFFAQIKNCLKPGGRAALQIITIAERHFDLYRRGQDYIQKYIFPGGMLPTKTKLAELIGAADLQLEKMHAFGRDYTTTLLTWDEKFQRAWPQICKLGYDDRFKRMWEQYLVYCAAGFKTGSIDVVQLCAQRPAYA